MPASVAGAATTSAATSASAAAPVPAAAFDAPEALARSLDHGKGLAAAGARGADHAAVSAAAFPEAGDGLDADEDLANALATDAVEVGRTSVLSEDEFDPEQSASPAASSNAPMTAPDAAAGNAAAVRAAAVRAAEAEALSHARYTPDEGDAAAAIARALAEVEDEGQVAAPILSPTAAALAAKPVLSPDIRDILREEAALEADARRQESQRSAARRADAESQIQTQPELGVDAMPVQPTSAVQRRLAMLKGARGNGAAEPAAPLKAEAEVAAPAAIAPAAIAVVPPAAVEAPRVPARRDLLPDVEEINSTLHPGADAYHADAAVDALPDLTRGNGFRTGFLLALSVLLLATGVYVAAGSIAALVPTLEPQMTRYVGFVDELRLWLNQSMDHLTHAISQNRG